MRPAVLLLPLWAAGVAFPPPAAAADPEITSPALGAKFVLIKPGKFRMGSPTTEPDRLAQEGPDHEVTIGRAFYLGTCEVTVGQFRKFVEDTGYKTEAETGGGAAGFVPENILEFRVAPKYNWRTPSVPQTEDHPVVCVSWNDAQKFCAWLSKKDGRTYRLPTEAEWEYACRAGAQGRWFTGDDPAATEGFANVADMATLPVRLQERKIFPYNDRFIVAAPVGRFKPNPWGLYDMHGNVCEWCQDGMRTYKKDPVADPKGPDDDTVRGVRGGSWYSGTGASRAAARNFETPDSRSVLIGFRLAMDAPAGK